jgi:ABC-type multidrug transport system fused ATPase/permease subunit
VLATFPLYNDQVGTLTAAKTYSILTIFRLIMAPVQFLMFGINAMTQSFASFQRIEELLKIPAFESHTVEDTSLP